MFWLFLTLLVIVGGLLMLRRKARFATSDNEPWRASLGDDEPLDMEEIQRAEKDWLRASDWEDLPEDEGWR